MYFLGVRVRKILIRHIYGRPENVYARHYVISCKKLIYRKLIRKLTSAYMALSRVMLR